MSDTPTPESGHRAKKRRAVPLVWAGSLLGATLLVLGVSGTLSSWTTAIITNDTNTASATTALALSESIQGNPTPCVDTSTVLDGSNAATCTTINKYGTGGAAAAAMSPGNSQSTDVTFKNTGNRSSATFGYTPGTCTDSTTPVGHLCTNGDLTVTVACSPGSSFAAGSSITGLAQGPSKPGSLVDTKLTAVIVAAGGQVTCHFTTALLSSAPATDASMTISQPMVWTLGS